jgi:hypothetical protein
VIKNKQLIFTVAVLFLFFLSLSSLIAKPTDAQIIDVALTSASEPVHVKVGVWLNNIEKVDLSGNSYRLDFYLWFSFDPSQISLDDVRHFEFINGSPAKIEIDSDSSYLEYRVKGDFITSFDFSQYPFDSHLLPVQMEHNNYDITQLVYEPDSQSGTEKSTNVAGWTLGSLQTGDVEHAYPDQTFSRFTFGVTIAKPFVSSFIKSILPISVITAISLLALFIAPQNFTMRITLAVTTLLAATTFNLSMLSGIPTTGYLTLADKIMIGVYALFLYNLASSIFIMRHVDNKKPEETMKIKGKAIKLLPFIVFLIVVLIILIPF